MEIGLIAIAAGIATLEGLFTSIGEGNVAAHAVDAIAKNPESEGKIRTTMILGSKSWILVSTSRGISSPIH